MKKLFALIVAGAFGVAAYAQESGCTKSAQASCDKSKSAATCCASKSKSASASSCCASKANDAEVARKAGFKMPTIEYVVGSERTCCDKMATEMAKGDKSQIRFAVAKDTFEKMDEAEQAYAKLLDSTLTDLTSPQYAVAGECMRCPISAKASAEATGKPVMYRLASFEFSKEAQAQKAAEVAKAAADKVEMKMYVGDECVGCPHAASEMAKAKKTQVQYAVGEMKTADRHQAEMELKKARVNAAAAAVARVMENA